MSHALRSESSCACGDVAMCALSEIRRSYRSCARNQTDVIPNVPICSAPDIVGFEAARQDVRGSVLAAWSATSTGHAAQLADAATSLLSKQRPQGHSITIPDGLCDFVDCFPRSPQAVHRYLDA